MKFVKCSLEFVDFRADVYRNFTKSCRIKNIIRYNNNLRKIVKIILFVKFELDLS